MTGGPFDLMLRQLDASATGPRSVASMSRLERLQLLQAFERAASAGRPIDPQVIRWLADAVRLMLARGGRLDEHMGIASNRRGTHQAPHKLLALHQRDVAIAAIFQAAPGAMQREKSEATVRIIHGQSTSSEGPARQALDDLRRLRPGVGLPTSGRQIVRIVHAQTTQRAPQG